MKKLSPIVLVVLLVFSFVLASCATTTPTTPATSASPTTPATTGPTEIKVGVPAAQTGGAAGSEREGCSDCRRRLRISIKLVA
jgi:hypothetical protein